MSSNKITCSEICHPVIQGEGALIGRKMILMRVHGCPIQCPQCDSYHTWDKTRLSEYKEEFTPEELASYLFRELEKYGMDTVLITGGEPQIYRNQLDEMIEIIQSNSPYDIFFDIETTGSVDWSDRIKNNPNVHFDLSPKIGSLEPKAKIKDWKLFLNKPQWYNLKVVIDKSNYLKDLETIRSFQTLYGVPNNLVYLMPLGTTRNEMIENSAFVLELAVENQYQFSPRLHLFIYNDKRLV